MHLHPFIHTSIIQLKNLSLSTELISFPAESGIPGHTYKTHAHIKKVNSSFCLSQQTKIIKNHEKGAPDLNLLHLNGFAGF